MRKSLLFFGLITLILSTLAVQGASYPEPFGEKPNCVHGNPFYNNHLNKWKCPVADAEPKIPVPQLYAAAAASVASNLDANAASGATTITTDGDSYKFEKTSTSYNLKGKDFHELYTQERVKEIMAEVDTTNSKTLNFCKTLNSSSNCSEEHIYDIYEGGSVSFLFEGKASYLKITKINSSAIIFNYDSHKHITLEGGATYNLNHALSVKLPQVKNKESYLEVVKLVFNLSPDYLCDGYYIYDKCYTTGNTFDMRNETYYVVNQSFEARKKVGDSCEFNYECESDSCVGKKCFSKTFIVDSTGKADKKTSSVITGAVISTEPKINNITHKIYCWLFKCENEKNEK